MSFALGSEPNSALGSALGSSATGSCSIICDRLVIDCQRREPARPVQMLDLFRRKICSRSDRADVDSDDAAGRSVRAIAPLRRRHQPKQTSDQRRGIFTSGGLQKTGDPVAAEAVAANPRGSFGDARIDVGRRRFREPLRRRTRAGGPGPPFANVPSGFGGRFGCSCSSGLGSCSMDVTTYSGWRSDLRAHSSTNTRVRIAKAPDDPEVAGIGVRGRLRRNSSGRQSNPLGAGIDPIADAIRAARDRSDRSPPGAASISRPTGSFSTDSPIGMVIAGRPAPLAGKVLRERNGELWSSPATGNFICLAISGAGQRVVGRTSASASAKATA